MKKYSQSSKKGSSYRRPPRRNYSPPTGYRDYFNNNYDYEESYSVTNYYSSATASTSTSGEGSSYPALEMQTSHYQNRRHYSNDYSSSSYYQRHSYQEPDEPEYSAPSVTYSPPSPPPVADNQVAAYEGGSSNAEPGPSKRKRYPKVHNLQQLQDNMEAVAETAQSRYAKDFYNRNMKRMRVNQTDANGNITDFSIDYSKKL